MEYKKEDIKPDKRFILENANYLANYCDFVKTSLILVGSDEILTLIVANMAEQSLNQHVQNMLRVSRCSQSDVEKRAFYLLVA